MADLSDDFGATLVRTSFARTTEECTKALLAFFPKAKRKCEVAAAKGVLDTQCGVVLREDSTLREQFLGQLQENFQKSGVNVIQCGRQPMDFPRDSSTSKSLVRFEFKWGVIDPSGNRHAVDMPPLTKTEEE